MCKYYMLNHYGELIYIGKYKELLQAMQYVDSNDWKFITLMDEGAAKAWLSRCTLVVKQTG